MVEAPEITRKQENLKELAEEMYEAGCSVVENGDLLAVGLQDNLDNLGEDIITYIWVEDDSLPKEGYFIFEVGDRKHYPLLLKADFDYDILDEDDDADRILYGGILSRDLEYVRGSRYFGGEEYNLEPKTNDLIDMLKTKYNEIYDNNKKRHSQLRQRN